MLLFITTTICLMLTPLTEAGSCNYIPDVYRFDITCSELSGPNEYLDEIYRIVATTSIGANSGYLRIDDSNLTEIGPWITSPYSTSVAQRIYGLTITNSGVQTILPGTFTNSRVSYLDLSYNNLDQFAFINERMFSNIYLNNNNFSNTFDLSSIDDAMLEYLETLDVSNNRIEKFINSPGRTIVFNLSNNRLTEFELVARAPDLDLSYNNITKYVENTTYWATYVDLSYNKGLSSISLTPTSGFSKQVLLKGDSNLKEIKTTGTSKIPVILDLSHSTELQITTSLLENVIVSNTLNLSYTNLASLRKSTLDLSGSIETRGLAIDMSQSNLVDIEENYFSQYSIRSLNLSRNNLNILKSNTFQSSVISEVLVISDSKVSTVEKDAFLGLNTAKLDLANNDITEVNFLNNLTVVELDLSNNPIKTIDENSFANCNNLQILKLTNAFIADIKPSSFASISRLSQLEISFNGNFSSNAIEHIGLQKLFLVNSSFSLSEDNFKGLYNLVELHFNDSEIQSFDVNSLRGLFKLQYLDTRPLFKSTSKLPTNLFGDLNSLTTLDLSNLDLDTIESNAFVGLNSLTELNLNDNKLKTFNAGAFNGLDRLRMFRLENNNLYDANFRFNNMVNLEELYFTGNRITNLAAGYFSGLTSLRILDLSNNKLSYAIKVPLLFPLTRLQILNLESNELGQIYDYELLFNVLPTITTIGLGNNTMGCGDLANVMYEMRRRQIVNVFFKVVPNYSSYNIEGVYCSPN